MGGDAGGAAAPDLAPPPLTDAAMTRAAPPPSQAGEVEDAEMAELLEEEEEDGGAGGQRVCSKHERALPIQQTVESLDMREEGEVVGGVEIGLEDFGEGVFRPLPRCSSSHRHRDPALLPGAAPPPLAGPPAPHLLLLPPALLRRPPAAPSCGAKVRTAAPLPTPRRGPKIPPLPSEGKHKPGCWARQQRVFLLLLLLFF